MLTVPATVCIAGARTKRGLIFTSIRTAWGCPGLLQGQGRSSPLGWGCSVLSRHIHGAAWELWPGDVSSAADRQPLPRVLLLPSHLSGRFLIPNPPGHPGEEPRVLAMPAAHHSAAISDVCPQRPTSAPAAPSPCGHRVGMPFSEICFNHIYTV